MINPVKLTIENYCQIDKRTIDFTKANVFAITAPNAYGKSNLLNAFRFALSGAASPEADRLIDDIQDGNDRAKVTFSFEADNNISGVIVREIIKGKGSVTLTISEPGKIDEVYSKSGQAEERFIQLLGVSPKYICEVIIAAQRDIDALLFWPAAERGPKFQKFLHGQIFAQIEILINKERKKIFLDANAKERLDGVKRTLGEQQELLKRGQLELDRTTNALNKEEVTKVKKKFKDTEAFTQFKQIIQEIEARIVLSKAKITSYKEELKKFPKNLQEQRTKEKTNLAQLTTAWDNYRPYVTALRDIKAAEAKCKALIDRNEEIKKETDLEESLKEVRTELEAAKLVARDSKELNSAKEEVAVNMETTLAQVKDLEQARKEETHNSEELIPLRSSLAIAEKALEHLKEHKAKQCFVCGGKLSVETIGQLKEQVEKLTAQIAPIGDSQQRIQAKIKALELTTAAKESELKALKSKVQDLTIQIESNTQISKNTIWETTSEAKLEETTAKLGVIPALKTEVIRNNNAIAAEEASIKVQKAVPEAEQPKNSEAELLTLRSKVTELDNDWDASNEVNTKLSEELGVEKTQSEAKEQQLGKMQELGLPKLEAKFALSEKEIELLEKIVELEHSEDQTKQRITGYQGAISILKTQLADIQKDIEGYEDTSEYLKALTELESWFKYNGIPSQILQMQLNALCRKMEDIIEMFSIPNKFKIQVDENLDVHMHYPSGVIRPIRKASGGERMILGLAFRLATHQYLAPEFPFLAVDEPSNHLHVDNTVVMQELFRGLRNNISKYGLKKLVYCTHSQALASEAEVIIDLSKNT